MLKKMGLSSPRAFCNASGSQGYQSTGLYMCCRRYGLVSLIKRFGIYQLPRHSTISALTEECLIM